MQYLNPSDPALLQHLIVLAQNTVSADATQRKEAEVALNQFRDQVDQQQGFATALLHLVANPSVPADAQSVLVTYFKNTVKACWDRSTSEHVLQDQEKHFIRENIFSVMQQATTFAKRQLTETIVLIAAVDFPSQWPSVLPTLVQPLGAPDAPLDAVDAALSTAHALFTRYRALEELTIESRDEIIGINRIFTEPLLKAMQRLATEMLQGTEVHRPLACKALTTSCEALYDLIHHDMGDEHEKHLDTFMGVFLVSLQCNDAQLLGRNGSGPLVALKSSVLNAVSLFVQRFDEEFEKYAPNMLRVIWEIVASTQYRDEAFDDLVISGMEVLCAASRGSSQKLLDEEEKLRVLCDLVILPNLSLSQADEALFDDEPTEYVDKDVDGSDLHTRRRAASELIRDLLAVFPAKVGPMFMQEVATLLQRYSTGGDWRAMDTAIYLVTALALEGGSASTQRGARVALNPNVPFQSFLESTILPEVSTEVSTSSHLILKADALRFLTTFRYHVPAHLTAAVVQHVIPYLSAKHPVLFSFAAHCLERFLGVVDPPANSPRVSEAILQPMAGTILAALCARLVQERVPNQHAMKCLMQICRVAPRSTEPYVGDIVMAMRSVLIEAAKNPSNPIFNHCLFEVVSTCVALAPHLYEPIEQSLWPVFEYILGHDVVEFVPYVLQVQAQLLDCRPAGEALSEPYQRLAAPLVMPVMYEHKGTIPAVVRLLSTIVRRNPEFVHAQQLTEKVLGVFRNLVMLKHHDHEGITILTAMILHYPKAVLEPYMPTVYQVLFQRLSASKTPKYVRVLIIFFSIVVIVYGAETVVNCVNNIQPGLFWMLLTRVWLVDMQKVIGTLERKVCVVALAALLCDSQQLVAEEETWFQCVYSCLKMIHGEVEKDDTTAFVPKTASLDELQQKTFAGLLAGDGTGSTNVFCPLAAAVAKPEDPAASITDPNAHFRQRLHQLVQQGANGAVLQQRLQSRLSPDLLALIA